MTAFYLLLVEKPVFQDLGYQTDCVLPVAVVCPVVFDHHVWAVEVDQVVSIHQLFSEDSYFSTLSSRLWGLIIILHRRRVRVPSSEL